MDVNFRQNALLDLKLAFIRDGHFGNLFEMFGIGSHEHFDEIYRNIRAHLAPRAQTYWDRNIDFFSPGVLKKSFYYHGTAGTAAWMLGGALFKAKANVKSFALCLFDAATLDQQREVYSFLEPRIWGQLSTWLVRQSVIMTLLGVPRPQIQLIEQSYPGGLASYVKDKLRHVMAELPTAENYFWRVYVTGSYTLACCPEYLRKENLPVLRERLDRVHAHTSTVSQFLQANPGQYSHFVLLDHQDWLAWHDPDALLEEWELILKNSRPGTRILMRSAGLDLSFVPAQIQARLRFQPERTAELHHLDRVGTYGSLHFAEVL